VAASGGRGVFDGNVRVERLAQGTDAGQLSRNLLLVPRATVNVKPNLQIVADDVKCTHGCAVSDLEEDQLFYFRRVHQGPCSTCTRMQKGSCLCVNCSRPAFCNVEEDQLFTFASMCGETLFNSD
jgi:hypothetical protein